MQVALENQEQKLVLKYLYIINPLNPSQHIQFIHTQPAEAMWHEINSIC